MDEQSLAPLQPVGELLLAAFGMGKILERQPIRIGAGVRREASGIPNRIRRMVRQFLEDGPDGAVQFRDITWDRAAEALAEPLADEYLGSVSEYVTEPAHIVEFIGRCGAAYDYLQSQMPPRRSRETLAGVDKVRPNLTEFARFRRAWNSVNDVISVFEDLRGGTISRDQVMALKAVYPGLYAHARGQIQVGILDMRTKRKTWVPSRRQDRVLEIFLGGTTLSPDLERVMQKSYGPADPNDPETASMSAAQGLDVAPPPSAAQQIEARQ